MVVPTFSAVIMSLNAPNRSFMFKNKKIRKKNFELFCVFNEYFPSIFLKIMLKNKVCVNLISKTRKYRVDVSQLCLQCYPGFLLSLLLKKSKHIFLRECFHLTLKNLNFEFRFEILQKRSSEVTFCFEIAFAKIWANFQIKPRR